MPNGKIPSLSKRVTNMGHKIPYVDIISDAILASPNHRLTAKEIFDFVSTKFGPMKSAETLKNTIRHTLSRYKVFRKVQRGKQNKPNWWTIGEDDSSPGNHIQDLQKGMPTVLSTGPPVVVGRQSEMPINKIQHRQVELVTGVAPSNVVVPTNQPYIALSYPSYPSTQPQQSQQVYYGGQVKPKQNGTGYTVTQGGQKGNATDSPEYKYLRLHDVLTPSPSTGSYNVAVAGDMADMSTYAGSFQLQELPNADTSAYVNYATSQSPSPQYYQM